MTLPQDPLVLDAYRGEAPVLGNRIRAWIPAVVAFVTVILLWEGAVRVFDIQAFVLPAPSVIVGRFITAADEIWPAGLNTLIEAVVGLIGGTVLGVLVAFLTVRWVPVREGLMPFAIAANYAKAGRRDVSFLWLRRARDARSAGIMLANAERGLDQYRTDPRFRELLGTVLTEAW